MPPDQRVRINAPPSAGTVTESLGLPAWIGSILDFLGGTPDDVAANAVTPLDLPAAAAVTLFTKAAGAGKHVPDVAARKAATEAQMKRLTELLSAPDISPQEAAYVLEVAKRNPRTLANQGALITPGDPAQEVMARSGTGIGALGPGRRDKTLGELWDRFGPRLDRPDCDLPGRRIPSRPVETRQPADIGRMALFPERMPPPGVRPDTLLAETFAHEMGHGAQVLRDPLMRQKYRQGIENTTDLLLEEGVPWFTAMKQAHDTSPYEIGAEKVATNQVQRIKAALEKAMSGPGPVTVSDPVKVNK